MDTNKSSTPEPLHGGRATSNSAFAISGVMLAVLLAIAAPAAQAAGFGEVQVGSQLGERLYARVPLIGEDASELATECVRLIPESALQDAPAIANARIGIDRRSMPPAVVVSTPAPVMEPAVRFVLEMGCGSRLRREFVLLIDPPDLPAIQSAATQGAFVPPAARVVPSDDPRWGNATGDSSGGTSFAQSSPAPVFDSPLAEPPVPAAPVARKAAPKPRPKPPVAQAAAKPRPPSAPPPPVRPAEPAKPVASDRLVLSDSDPAASQPAAAPTPTAEQAARDAREEALTKQIEALTKEVARMREDVDKVSARNRELVQEAESRTFWFGAAGLVVVLAGVGFGLLGRREKKPSWRENLAPADDDGNAHFTSAQSPMPEVREEVRAPNPVPALALNSSLYRDTAADPVTDLDVTKLDVQESTLMNTTAAAATTLFPSDVVTDTTLTPSEKKTALQSLDFSLDDFDTPTTHGVPPSPVFTPKPVSDAASDAVRASLFDEIEKVHRATKKS